MAGKFAGGQVFLVRSEGYGVSLGCVDSNGID
jgi:hypothetical protein